MSSTPAAAHRLPINKCLPSTRFTLLHKQTSCLFSDHIRILFSRTFLLSPHLLHFRDKIAFAPSLFRHDVL